MNNCFYKSCCRSICFETTLASASALASVGHDGHMAQLSGESGMTIDHFAIYYDSAAKARAKGKNNEILHFLCSSEYHLSHCCGICIVSYNNRDINFFLNEIGQRHYPFPGKIRGMFYSSPVVICIGSPYADSCQPEFLVSCKKFFYCSGKSNDKFFNFRIIGGFKSAPGKNFSFFIYQAKDCIGASDIYSCNYFFHINGLKIITVGRNLSLSLFLACF